MKKIIGEAMMKSRNGEKMDAGGMMPGMDGMQTRRCAVVMLFEHASSTNNK